MSEDTVLIIGGGAAGLTAADALSSEGVAVGILEARGRLGGRINTVQNASGSVPIELGAEFVHGAKNATWRIIRAAGFKTEEAPDSHWETINGVLVKNVNFWDELEGAMENIDCDASDQDFASYLAGQRDVEERARWLATEYVEGFHAAPADMMSAHALKKAERRAEEEEGTRQFRLTQGYSRVIEWLANRVNARGAAILLNQDVRVVRWKSGRVEVLAETSEGLQKHRGMAAVVTLPLGVLQAEPEEGVLFDPELPGKRGAIRGLGMGPVLKITFRFTERFWPIENFGFIHSHESMFPVWWSDGRGPMLTAWSGAGRASWLARESGPAVFDEAVGCLGRLFNLQPDYIQKRIAGIYHHDWINDRFARGAYSFAPTGMIHAPGELAKPVSDTLFFAGEATARDGNQGTVQGAIASGERAAREVLKAFSGRHKYV